MGITLANNAHTTLAANISSTDTTIYVDDVDSFPTLGVDEYFYCTIESTTGTYEIVKVTQTNSTSFIVVRGQENTIAVPFNAGARVELRITVQTLNDQFYDMVDDAAADAVDDALTAAIGTTVQAYDADLTTWASLTPSANAQSLVTAANYAAMRSLLSLGTAALQNTGTSGANVPLLNGANTWSGANTFGTGSSAAQLAINGGTGAANGPYITGMQGSVPKWSIGTYSAVVGTTDPDLVVYTDSGIADDLFVYDGAKQVVYRANGTDVAVADGGTGASTAADARTNLGLVIGTNVQAYDADLTTWAGITPATGVGTFLATPSSANLKSAITDETGSGGALVFATGPTLNQPNIVGTTTNDSAAAGSVGELIISTVTSGSAVSATSGIQFNITSISLTAGDWDVSADVRYNGGATTTVGAYYGSISNSSATFDSGAGRAAYGYIPGSPAVFGAVAAINHNVGPVRISVASTTTIYMVGLAVFGTSTMAGYGTLRARRVR